MRTEMIQAATAAQARKLAPWAAKFAKVSGGYMAFESPWPTGSDQGWVSGGYMAFESVADYETWKRQR